MAVVVNAETLVLLSGGLAHLGVPADDASRNLAEALSGRPRRRVVEHPHGWTVTPDDFTTTERLDRVDPLD
jgi:hypothetical protein